MNKLIAALSTGLSVVALGAAIAYAQTFTMPPPAGVAVIGCVYQLSPPVLSSGTAGYAQCDSTGHIATGGGGGGGGAITGPLGPSTAPVSAVAITDTGTPITGQTLGAGGQGLTGWMSQVVAAITNNLLPTGTAGTPATTVLTMQGISGMTPVNTTSNTAQVNGVTTLTGAGATGTGAQRVTAAQDTTTIAGSAPGTAGTASANVLSVQGIGSMTPVQTQQSSQYPVGSTPITISATGTTAATTATLAANATLKTYICGFSIRANATAAATGNATITGTVTGTLNFTQWTAPLASGLGINEQVFMPCVPSSATNTAIAIISAAPGSGGVVSVTGWGYQAP